MKVVHLCKNILSIALGLLILTIPALAQGDALIKLEATTPDNAGNTTVTVNLSAEDAPAMLQFCLSFDSYGAQYLDASYGSVFDGNTAPTVNVVGDKIYFVWDSLTPIEGTGTLLQLKFKCREGKTAEIWLDPDEETVICDLDFNEITLGKTDKVTISSPIQSDQTIGEPEGIHNGSPSITPPKTTAETVKQGCNKGLSLETNAITMQNGSSRTLSVSGTEDALVWSSSNESVVTVENGTITAIASGTAMITVSTEDGSNWATCLVNVSDSTADNAAEGGITGAWQWLWFVVIIAVVLAAVYWRIRKKRMIDKEG